MRKSPRPTTAARCSAPRSSARPDGRFLALAGDGDALEFGIGTGRVALPLAQRGVRVHGIDLSKAMVAKLREKPGVEQIGTTIGDFATTRVEGTFLACLRHEA